MSGVVYSGVNDLTLGRLGAPIAVAAGGLIPPGQFFGGAWSATIGGTATPMAAGFITSDGTATLTAAGNVIPLGAGNPYKWPWGVPWPLSQMPWPPPS